jgi:DNA-binding beta-propeller fold protein YncE
MPRCVALVISLLTALLIAGLSGCASAPEQASALPPPPVYPPPPDKPRFIFERTLLYSDDVEEYTAYQRFREFATGSSRKLHGMVKPFDVAVHKRRVYVSDSVQRNVMLFDIPGKHFAEIGVDEPGQLKKPLGIAISPGGDLYVADITLQRVMVYDRDGHFLRAIGSPEQLRRPSDVAISPDGRRLYVVDTGGIDTQDHHVYVYDSHSGDYLQRIGTRGTGKGQFNLPLQAAVDAEGRLYVVDGGNFRIEVFDADGNYLSSFGSVGRLPGQFARPKGIAIGPNDNSYVVDAAFGNIQLFNPQGQLLMVIGERGHAGLPGKYMLPAGIAVGEDGRIYVVDQFFRKVDIYRPIDLPADESGKSPDAAQDR